MNYALNKPTEQKTAPSPWTTLKTLGHFAEGESMQIAAAFFAILVTSGLNLIAPLLVGHAIDTYIVQGDFSGVLLFSGILLIVYLTSFGANYAQMMVMGGVSQRVLFKLRNTIFLKLQSLPIAFFQANKSGDLISRLNNDTDKLNQFFSEIVMRFAGNLFFMIGTAGFLLSIEPRLGLAALVPALVATVLTRLVQSFVKQRNTKNLQAVGGMSAAIQENLSNFKVMAVFHRRDYLKKRLHEVSEQTYKTALRAGFVNGVFAPTYDFSANLAQLIVVGYGAYLVTQGLVTVGIVISFLLYVERFYGPFRQIAMLWSSFQVALAGWERVSEILSLSSNLERTVDAGIPSQTAGVLSFQDVSFGYTADKEILHHVSFTLEAGKTYALVGPTGGGKTTTASLMARLYDATAGTILLTGQDIRSYDEAARTQKIGFILQEPFLFSGSLRDNLVFGHPTLATISTEELQTQLEQKGFGDLLKRFPEGLASSITTGQEHLSLGQKQLVAFMRAVLREPDLLILDEATANIDTVTEQLLEEILEKLPPTTTKVVIAHRLNTIKNADEIFFVNNGELIAAGSFEKAVDLLMHKERKS